MAVPSPASPCSQTLDGELSFNLFHHADSTLQRHRSPATPHAPTYSTDKCAGSSPRRRRLGESPLRPRDSNAPLIDVESSEAFDGTPKLLAPRTPSGFARSLLDKTPGVWKAQLGTPLIPLGTPVTHRKKVDRRTPAPSSGAKENATPEGSVRRSARLAVASPCPVLVASSPTPTASSSPAVVESSVSPQQVVGIDDDEAADEQATALHSQAVAEEATEANDDTPAAKSPVCTPEKPRMNDLGSRLVPRSPFEPFSPATPAPRLLASSRSREDSDYGIDNSILEDSFSAAVDPRQTAVLEAFQRLTFRDSPVKAATCSSSSSETALVEDSVVLTATEVESSEDDFDDEVDESVELEAICEEDDGEDAKSTDPSSASETEAEADDENLAAGADDIVVAIVDLPEQPVAEQPEQGPDDADTDADAAEDGSVSGTSENPLFVISSGSQDPSVLSAAPDAALLSVPNVSPPSARDGPEVLAESKPVIDTETENAVDTQAISEASMSPPQEDEAPRSTPLPTATPSAPASSAHEDEVESQVEGTSVAAVAAALGVTANPDNTEEDRKAGKSVAESAETSILSPQSSPGRLVLEPALSSVTSSAVEAAAGTPARSSQSAAIESTTPAATPPTRLSTPSAIGTAQTLVNAAPTARRQLTKLTSVASQRSGVPVKSSLTALTPAAASGSLRGLPVPSRLAAPKRADDLSTSRSDVTGPNVAAAVRQRAPAAQTRLGLSSTGANPLRSSALSASTSSTSSLEQSRAPRPLTRPAPRAATSSHAKSTDVPSEQARLGRPPNATRARLAPTIPIGSTTMVSTRSGVTSGPRPTTTEAARIGARPRPATTTRSLAASTGPSQALAKTGSLTTVAPLTAAANGRTPRAALSMRQTTSAPTLSASTTLVSLRELETKSAEDARLSHADEAGADEAGVFSLSSTSPGVAPTASASTPDRVAKQAGTAVLGSELSAPKAEVPIRLRSPTRTTVFASPAHLTAAQPPRSSPLRSPRRVIVSQSSQRSQHVAPKPATSLLAPAPALSAAAPAVFGGPTRPVQPRMTRTTRRTAAAGAVPSASAAPALPAPLSRPVRAAAANARVATGSTSAPGPPPGGRMARKLTRRPPTPVQHEAELVAESPAVEANDAPPAAKADETATASLRPQPTFRPAPTLTQDELNRLTQRNTKKNQQTFNQLKVETVFLDYDRPPSPTSKIRKTSALANAASKEGREARAAKRRNALRASVDGSELEALSLELSEDAIETPPKDHYRAPGDEEPYITPARTASVLKSESSGKAANKKKRTSAEANLDAATEKPVRRVRWDRALVYAGRREGYAKPSQEGIIVIKTAEIDPWGNPTAPATNLGKAIPVTIQMRVFKNDDK